MAATQGPLAIAATALPPRPGTLGGSVGGLREERSILAETLLGGDETARGADTAQAKSTIAPTGQSSQHQKRTLVGFEDYKGGLSKKINK